MKTPEEIADETATEFDTLPSSGDELVQLIAKAIEADRKQRNPGSASERSELAQGVLDSAPGPDRERALASVVQLFLNQPLANESCKEIARRIMDDPRRTSINWQVYQPNEEQVFDIATRAASAGMDAAFESWEPDEYAEPETVAAALRRALLDRGDAVAAEWVVANGAELWGQVIGPLLDTIQKSYGGVAAWSPTGEPLPPVDAAARFEADVESAIRSEARTAVAARGRGEYDENDPRL